MRTEKSGSVTSLPAMKSLRGKAAGSRHVTVTPPLSIGRWPGTKWPQTLYGLLRPFISLVINNQKLTEHDSQQPNIYDWASSYSA